MVTITCDVCAKQRAGENTVGWFLGFDVLAASAPMQRSINFLQRWEDRRVLEPGAVHFCCEQCKNTYIENAQAA